jgi:hypothetical protein
MKTAENEKLIMAEAEAREARAYAAAKKHDKNETLKNLEDKNEN